MKFENRIRPRVEELEGRLAPAGLSFSTNWSGYAVSAGVGAVSRVAGNWVVPAIASAVAGYSSAWVGIDGFNSNTVQQIGTDGDYVNGVAQYYAWYEMYPAGFVKITSLAISPGDTISASVHHANSNKFVLSITNVTTGGSFSTTQISSQAKRSSAEWIVEAPSSITGVLPLADFGTINFSGASATINGTTGPADNTWAGSTLYQVNMVDRDGTVKATTSSLSDSGSPATSSFSVTFVSSGSGKKGGKGGGHKSTNLPLPNSISVSSFSSTVLASVAANRQGTPAAFVAAPAFGGALSPLSVGLPILPGSHAAAPIFGHVGVDNDNPDGLGADAPKAPDAQEAGQPDGQGAGPANTPKAPLRKKPTVPTKNPSDGVPTPPADPTPANTPGESPEMSMGIPARHTDGFWLPVGSLGSARGVSHEHHEAGDFAIAGLVLALALNPTWLSAIQEATGESEGMRDWSRPHRDDRRLRPRLTSSGL